MKQIQVIIPRFSSVIACHVNYAYGKPGGSGKALQLIIFGVFLFLEDVSQDLNQSERDNIIQLITLKENGNGKQN